MEWKPIELMPLRTGISFAGGKIINWLLGFGFDFCPVEMNFATSNFNNVLKTNSAKGLDVSFGSRWKF